MPGRPKTRAKREAAALLEQGVSVESTEIVPKRFGKAALDKLVEADSAAALEFGIKLSMAHALKVLRMGWDRADWKEKKFVIAQQTDVMKTMLNVGIKIGDQSLRQKTAGKLNELIDQIAKERVKPT